MSFFRTTSLISRISVGIKGGQFGWKASGLIIFLVVTVDVIDIEVEKYVNAPTYVINITK